MMRLREMGMRRRLQHAHEHLDEPHHDRAELVQCLDQVAEVNRLLGGVRAVLRSLEELVPRGRTVSILDVGTGSADIPIAIDDWARRRGLDASITATDIHPQVREIAAERTRDRSRIRVEAADALHLPCDADAFDIVVLSLTLHHFEGADQLRALREAGRVARCGVVVNELERCVPNYIGARILAATRWRGNRMTRHDGPLSVQRAFTRAELHALGRDAGLRVRSVRRHFFYRLVLTATV